MSARMYGVYDAPMAERREQSENVIAFTDELTKLTSANSWERRFVAPTYIIINPELYFVVNYGFTFGTKQGFLNVRVCKSDMHPETVLDIRDDNSRVIPPKLAASVTSAAITYYLQEGSG